MEQLIRLWEGSGLYNISFGQAFMLLIGLLLLFLAIKKKFEPLLLVPIGFGAILANIPMAGLAESASFQAVYKAMTYESAMLERYIQSNDISGDDAAKINFSMLNVDSQNSKNKKTADLVRSIRAAMGDALQRV
ncbi:MAG: sodium ion-translocating decarboxylase subunit beta [gamma proteobacterium symbiont of Bathyaustriella thionipta]|nr:sodium ion-translocating decarboxylase subunit beta [gamma proteobacterium symbiont of Bathyaustriella thionipta]MCU7951092.1 sodium ion-translocating decarboxylase subunit beta [gamma proteobacterium symbiont of Bathyaustriella thionipta]MCU7952017.1 sodium ion-translocating decarboxylase subunit beta [gamma proteobacterium symbiont of Bathyaustriella thionipta]MCU7957603.1 sodium ion-translocating decarboxylase subunit beta [gamma proteobacterium symbiont of Bathyaustriella thionipta]